MKLRATVAVSVLLLSALSLAPSELLAGARGATIEALVGQLSAEKAHDRARAADALGKLGRDAAPAVSALLKALSGEAWVARAAAASALGRIALQPEKVVPALAKAARERGSIADEEHGDRPEDAEGLLDSAKNEDVEIRWRSLIALGRYIAGKGDAPISKEELGAITNALAGALHDRERLVRDTAGDAAADLGNDVAVGILSGAARRGSIDTRVSAILSLGRVAPQAGGDACLRVWEDSMRNAPQEVWQAYTDTWWRQAEAELAGMDAWSKAKPDPGWPARASAIRALKSFGENARAAVPELIEALGDRSWQVRLAALEVLEQVDNAEKRSAPEIGALLTDSERIVRRATGRTLLKMGHEAAIRACVEALESKCVTARTSAAEVLSQIGPAAEPAIPALLAATDAWKLPPSGWLSGDHSIAILLLITRCCEAIAAVGPAGADAVPQLIEVMERNSNYCADRARLPLRPSFALAFGSLGKDGAATESLMAALESKDANVRLCAIESLGEIGPPASGAVPKLLELMKVPGFGEVVIGALGKIGAGAVAAVPLLVERLDAVSHRDRESAAEALGRIGAGARSAIPALCNAVRDPVADVRWYALNALGRIGSDSKEALAAVRWALHEDRHVYVRRAAAGALLAWGAEKALPVLREGLGAERWGTRAASARGLAGLGEKAGVAVPELRKALRDEDRDVRRAAVEALGKIGPAAKDGVPELGEGLSDFHRCVRRAAAEALVALGRELPEGYDPDMPVRRERQ